VVFTQPGVKVSDAFLLKQLLQDIRQAAAAGNLSIFIIRQKQR